MDLKKEIKKITSLTDYKNVPNINIRFLSIFTMVVFTITLFFVMRNLFQFSNEYKKRVVIQEKALVMSFVKNRAFTDLLLSKISMSLADSQLFSSTVSNFPNVLHAEIFSISPKSGEAVSIDSYTSPTLSGRFSEFMKNLRSKKLSATMFPTYLEDIVVNGKFIGKIKFIFTREGCSRFVASMRISSILNSIYLIIASLIIGWLLSKMLTVPIETITANIDYISKGHFKEYIQSSRIGPEGRLIASINSLMQSLNQKVDEAGTKSKNSTIHLNKMLRSSVDRLSEGLIIINPDNSVLLVNKAFSKLFGLDSRAAEKKHFYEIFKEKDTLSAIRDVRLKSHSAEDLKSFAILEMPFKDKIGKFNLNINSFENWEKKKLSMLFFEFIEFKK